MSGHSKVLFIFPGQGSQYCGIGSDIYAEHAAAREVYQRASEVLGYDVAKLSFEGPEQEITLTRFTQPILLTHHIACLEVFKQVAGNPPAAYATAGHSLGEYSALVAAGAISFEAGLELVQHRGELMGELGEGEMLALPLPLDEARLLADPYFCAVAGSNLAEQTVVGGRNSDLDRLEMEFARVYPRKRSVRLKTEGAFHTYYMVAAAQRFRPVLDAASIAPTEIKVLCNYTGTYHQQNAASIKTRLFFQLFHPVLWLANLNTALADGIDTVIEFGGGIGKGEGPSEKRPNLESMIKKVQRGTDYEAVYHSVINLQSLDSTADVFAMPQQ